MLSDVVDSVVGYLCQILQSLNDGIPDGVIPNDFSGEIVFLICRIAQEQSPELAVFGSVQLLGKVGAIDGKAVGSGVI